MKTPKIFSEEELPNDEDIYDMKMINWLSHPEIPDLLILETQILSIELDSMDSSKKNKKTGKIKYRTK